MKDIKKDSFSSGNDWSNRKRRPPFNLILSIIIQMTTEAPLIPRFLFAYYTINRKAYSKYKDIKIAFPTWIPTRKDRYLLACVISVRRL